MTLLEVCVESAAGARAAEDGGAHRVELCAGLVEGGVTPSCGQIALTCEQLDIPVVVMIRPRGGDFCYSPSELEVMERDIARAHELGAAGVAFGVLTEEAHIDERAMRRLVSRASPLVAVCHRAFDYVPNAVDALESLIEVGVSRVLTSGQAPTVTEGLRRIAELVFAAEERLVVVPAGGVRERNIAQVVAGTGAREIHFTAGVVSPSPMSQPAMATLLASADPPGIDERKETRAERVREFVRALECGE